MTSYVAYEDENYSPDRVLLSDPGINVDAVDYHEEEREDQDRRARCQCVEKRTCFAIMFGSMVLLGRSMGFIATPLWLDSLKPPNNTGHSNFTNSTPGGADGLVDPYFMVIYIPAVFTIVCGLLLAVMIQFFPGQITERERSYPKVAFFISGAAQALSSLLFNLAAPGSRMPPYISGILANFNVPIMFTTRFLILRKRPTLRKILCALIVLVAEFVCLLPSIFPSLENSHEEKDEGGATGIARFLWSMCFVSSLIPMAISMSVIEAGVQRGQKSSTKVAEINIVYYLFWYNLFYTIAGCALFWMDIIPGFGLRTDIVDLGKTLVFNLGCAFGQGGCGPVTVLLYYLKIASTVFSVLFSMLLIRYSEGANFLVILLCLRTPIVFIFWTLFQENPFMWKPHAHLSAWLSIGAIVVMFPAIYFYSTGAPETVLKQSASSKRWIGSDEAEHEQPLVNAEEEELEAQNTS